MKITKTAISFNSWSRGTKLVAAISIVLWASLAGAQQNPSVPTSAPPLGVQSGGGSISLKTFTVTQSEPAGGEPATGAITLSAAAPAPGLTVRLTSTSGHVQVPATVSIAPNASSATFAIVTTSVSVDSLALVTASLAGSNSLSRALTIQTLRLSQVTIPANHVVGGQSVTLQLVLNGHAPKGGFTVNLASTSVQLNLPSTLTIPEHTLGSTMSISTQSVPGGIFSMIQASAATGSASASVTVWGTGLAASAWPQEFGNAAETSRAVSPVLASAVQKWKYAAPATVTTQISVGLDGCLYFGCENGELYCLNPGGSLAWTFSTGAAITSHPALGANGLVYFGSEDGNFYAVHATTGVIAWKYAYGKALTSSPTIASDGTVYVSPNSKLTLGFEGDNGKVQLNSPYGSFRSDAVLASNGILMMPANNYGCLGALRLKDDSVQYGLFPWVFYSNIEMGRPMLDSKGELYEMTGGYDGGGLGETPYYGSWVQASNWLSGNIDIVGSDTHLDFNLTATALGDRGIYSADYTWPVGGLSLYGFDGTPLTRVNTGLNLSQVIVTSDEGVYVIGSKIAHVSGPAAALIAYLPNGNSWSIPGSFQRISVGGDSTVYAVSGTSVCAFGKE